MKGLLLLFLSMVGVAAQVPTFKSFNPTQFQTNNFIISITNGALVTNINSISTLNLNGTNIVNLFAPSGVTNGIVNSWNLLNPIFLRLNGAFFTNIFSGNLMTGTNDLFTVPVGYRFSAAPLVVVATTNTAGSTLVKGLLKIGANYYPFPNNIATVTNTPTSGGVFGGNNSYYFEAGEVASISVTRDGANVWMSGILFPDTAPVRTIKLLAVTTGQDLLYTVPASTGAFTVDNSSSIGRSINMSWVYMNASGGARTLEWYLVTPSAAVNSTTLLKRGPVTDETTTSGVAVPSYLPSGTSLYIVSDAVTAVQWTYVSVYEVAQ